MHQISANNHGNMKIISVCHCFIAGYRLACPLLPLSIKLVFDLWRLFSGAMHLLGIAKLNNKKDFHNS